MSVSKLESLPNEILIDILENYINGLDIFTNFAFQLNQRFDSLISQCQRLRFDFMKCHKVDFHLCIDLLPTYIDKIEELSLSEQNAPGQVHTFLSSFPSFAPFKQLRKLYLHINGEAVEWTTIHIALQSLRQTTLETLSMKVTKVKEIFLLDDAIIDMFCLRTLKKFSIDCDIYTARLYSLTGISSNIEYLKISGMCCNFQDLEYIFQCVPNLKYLNIQINSTSSYTYFKQKQSSKNNMISMSKLQTMIFNIEGDDQETFLKLNLHLKNMPCLYRLKIKAQNSTLFDASAWETLLKTSLPSLTYLNLKSDGTYVKEVDIHDLLESFQTSFWIEKKYFNIIITKNEFFMSEPQKFSQYGLNTQPVQLWIGPRRRPNTNLSSMNNILILNLSIESSFSFKYHYFGNVYYLILRNLNDELLEWIKKHINCSRIKHLDISLLDKASNINSSLLSCIRNITSLRIKLNQVLDNQYIHWEKVNCLKFLDLSANQHSFNEKCIITIGKLFPNIEHLTINTRNLQNVPILQTYLPRLRSLTFAIVAPQDIGFNDYYKQKQLNDNLRRKTQLLFQCHENWITIWMDEAAFQEPFWKIISTR